MKVHAYVIMSNHVHLILSTEENRLSNVLRDFKSHTSKEIIKSMQEAGESRRGWMMGLFKFAASKHKRKSGYQLWVHDNHPIELISNHFFDQKIDYIHHNPVEAGIVEKSEDYLYSSARDYAGGRGLVEIHSID